MTTIASSKDASAKSLKPRPRVAWSAGRLVPTLPDLHGRVAATDGRLPAIMQTESTLIYLNVFLANDMRNRDGYG